MKNLSRLKSIYSFSANSSNNNVYATRSSQSNKIQSFKIRLIFFKYAFFPAVITGWNILDINVRNSSSIDVFKKELLKLIVPEPNLTGNISESKGLKLLTRLRLGLSHLGNHKFKHYLSTMCFCGQDIQTTTHFLLHCSNHQCAK